MKKLLILALDNAVVEPVFSWPIRHQGADICYYGHGWDRVHECLYDYRHSSDTRFPDTVVYSAVCGGPSMPNIEQLKWFRSQARSVMICWDAGNPDWHPLLRQYKDEDVFDMVVGVDGAVEWPRREEQDISALCPINPEYYQPSASSGPGQSAKNIDLGFAGSYTPGQLRHLIFQRLGDKLTIQRREHPMQPYAHCAEFNLRCRAVLNVAETDGRHGAAKHVKARCVEAALAGAMLFETVGSPLRHWLTPGQDYVEYETPDDVLDALNCPEYGSIAAEMGERLRKKIAEHHPSKFWERFLG